MMAVETLAASASEEIARLISAQRLTKAVIHETMSALRGIGAVDGLTMGQFDSAPGLGPTALAGADQGHRGAGDST